MLVNTSQDCMSVKNLLPGERPATQAVVDSWESSFGALQNLDDMLEAFVPRLTCKHFVFTETGYYPVARLRTNAEVYYVFDTDTSEWIIDANLDGSGKIDYQSAPINPPTNSTFQNSPVKALSYKEMFARQWTMLPKKGEQMVKTNVVRGLFLGCIELLSIELDAQCLPGVDNYEYFHSMGKLLARSRRMYDQCFV